MFARIAAKCSRRRKDYPFNETRQCAC